MRVPPFTGAGVTRLSVIRVFEQQVIASRGLGLLEFQPAGRRCPGAACLWWRCKALSGQTCSAVSSELLPQMTDRLTEIHLQSE